MKKQNLPLRKTPEEMDLAEAQIVEQSKRIEFYLTEYSVELLANKMKENEFVVPKYQREFTWENDRKSRFIESLIIGLPIPFLFFWEMPDGRLEIVDGSQRLRTICEFIKYDFRLGDLESLTALSGFTFNELPESRQRKIQNRSIRGIVLNEHADEQARFDLFDRINTSSKIANKAEVRRGALTGPFMEVIAQLAQDPVFVRLAPASKKEEDERSREELVTRFFAYGDGLDDYKDRPSEFLFNYVKRMNDRIQEEPHILNEKVDEFHLVMSAVSDIFPHGFRRTPNGKFTPNSRFEAIALGTKLALEERSNLLQDKELDVSQWAFDKVFRDVIGSDGANAKAKLINRMNFVKNKLLE